MNSMMNNSNNNNNSTSRSSLSSQRAALEAASKEDDSPPPAPSPQNTNRGKLDQKLGDDMKIKMEIDDDKNDSGDKSSKMDESEDRKMGSKWMEPGDIKSEKSEQLDMNTNVIGRDSWNDFKEHGVKQESKMDGLDVKVKGEPMSPPSSSDSQALVKSELKLEPVANTTDKKKKCSKLDGWFVSVGSFTNFVFFALQRSSRRSFAKLCFQRLKSSCDRTPSRCRSARPSIPSTWASPTTSTSSKSRWTWGRSRRS